MDEEFKATHAIIIRPGFQGEPEQRIEVMKLDESGCLFTREEWDSETGCDWAMDDYGVLFQGGPLPWNGEYELETIGK